MNVSFVGTGAVAQRFKEIGKQAEAGARRGSVAAAELIRDQIPLMVNSRDARGREPYESTFVIREEASPPGALLYTNAVYARLLEFGHSGFVQVRQHQRGKATVHTYTRRMDVPARHILARSVEAAKDRAIDLAFEDVKRNISAS